MRAVPKTWHTTLLAEVGPNAEGPLPWIERDYTPISSAKAWEQGSCEILIKLYLDGKATSWLHRLCKPWLDIDGGSAEAVAGRPTAPHIWLSKPVQTLLVPTLVHGGGGFRPQSVLLLLAGTGAVALPQILAHRDPYGKLAIATPTSSRLRIPIDMVLSCREDDVLMLPEIAQWCEDAVRFKEKFPDKVEAEGLRRCTLLLTPRNATAEGEEPFPNESENNSTHSLKLQQLPNFSCHRTRINPALLSDAVNAMPAPCRVVVSGPDGFNSVVREMLANLQVGGDHITILKA